MTSDVVEFVAGSSRTGAGSSPTADDGPIWSAPGSVGSHLVAAGWRRRHSLSDLRSIPGPWGVVLWNDAGREHLVVADPIGVQPLHWARTRSGTFAVSSWLDRLLVECDVDDAIDYEGVLLAEVQGLFGEDVLHRTRFRAVSRVPGGHALRIGADGSVRLERYWDPRSLPGPDPSLTLDDAADLLRDAVDTAIGRLVPTDATVGGHVSGGLDCTAVTCRTSQVLTEAGTRLVAGYSWAPSEQDTDRLENDERPLLDQVAAQEGFPVRRADDDGSGDWYFELDQDRYPQTAHARERFVLPQARADGVQLLVSGWGGDELASFNGRGVLRHLVRSGRLAPVWRQTSRRVAITRPESAGIGRRAKSFGATLLDSAPPWVPDPRHRTERREQLAARNEIDALLRSVSPLAADTMRRRIDTFEQARDHHEFQLGLLTGGHLQRRCDGWYQTGRLFGVDYRYPLLDLDVVTTALRLPWRAYLSDGWTRTAFRLAVEPWVPPAVAWNVNKYEPALFSTATRAPRPGAVMPPWREDDDRYQHVISVARQVSELGRGRPLPVRTVHARSDAAPRRR